MTFRKFSQVIIYYILPLALAILVWQDIVSFNILGITALYLLFFILIIKPLAVIFKAGWLWKIISYRRELGIAIWWFFIFHGLGMIISRNLQWSYFTNINNSLFWCLSAGIGILILSLTANNISVRLLKKNWKRLHYLAYLIFLAAFYHASLAQDELMRFYIIASVFIILKIIEKLLRKKL